jgi:hypothetical protein
VHVVDETSACHLTSLCNLSFTWGCFMHSDTIKFMAQWRLFILSSLQCCKKCVRHIYLACSCLPIFHSFPSSCV